MTELQSLGNFAQDFLDCGLGDEAVFVDMFVFTVGLETVSFWVPVEELTAGAVFHHQD